MADYYGVSDELEKKSITEILVEKYRLKLDSIEQGFSAHQERAGYNDYEIDVNHNEELDLDNPSFWYLTKRYIEYKINHLIYGIYGASEPNDFTETEQIEKLLIQKKTATSYNQWYNTCIELDNLQKLNNWKDKKESTLYNYELIENNLNELREARLNKDIRKLLYLIRTTWTRNIGNIGNVNLFRHLHVGTKTLIDDYLKECELALEVVTNTHGSDDRYILSMLVQTRKNIGRTALVLSGGGCFGLFHIGVLAALLEEDVLPRIISGSSAGSIVASILSVHTNDEITELLESIIEKKFNIFDNENNDESFLTGLSRFFKYGTWYDSKNLQNTMIEFLGDLTFREAYNRTGRILNITVSPVGVHEQPRLLNHLTAPTVLIWSAVCASCSLPGIFQSSTIYEKNIKTGQTQEWNHTSVKFVDGSVDNDVPITRLSEMFNVDHIIACQVNPHVVPMLKLSVTCVGGEIETEYSAKLKTKLNQIYDFWVSESTHYLQMIEELGIGRNLCTKIRSILNQQYSGNITILPDLNEVIKLNKMLSNPTPEYLLHCTMNGARATWPKIAIIKNHCGLEFALDNAIKLLRSRNFKHLIRSNNLPLVNSPNLMSDDKKDSIDNISLSNNEKRNSLNDFQNILINQDKLYHHNRHRSETLSVGTFNQLRHQSTPIKKLVRSSSQQLEKIKLNSSPRFQLNRSHNNLKNLRSNSASNDSEVQSPLSFSANNYFSKSSPIKKRPKRSHSTNLPYTNVDDFDGLFDSNEKTYNSSEEEIDPIKDHTF